MNASENNENGRPSFLDQILTEGASNTAEASSASETPNVPSAPNAPTTPPPPKKREPMKPAQFMKMLGALFLVALIFFGSFLAYVVFNPGQARFFIRFGINPGDVATLLSRLVNGIFGSITFILCVVWVIFLFRAIITKKEYRRKKTVYAIISGFLGVVLFSNIGFWAFLFQKIGASDFVNPNGGVVAYDNDLYLSDKFKDSAEIVDFNNMIGPVTVRYDLSSDAKFASKTIDIDEFEIDYDGDGTVDKTGSDPATDKSLTYAYDRKGKFSPKGTYSGYDRVTHEKKVVPIEFTPINIAGLVETREADKSMVFDASDLKSFGNVAWYTSDDLDVAASREYKFTTKMESADKFVCLAISNDPKKKDVCDRIFFVKSKTDTPITAAIKYTVDGADPLKYSFSLTDKRTKSGGDIESVRWYLNDTLLVSQDESFDYSFTSYGDNKISAELTDTAGNKVTISEKISIKKPLLLVRNSNSDSMLKVTDEAGNSLLAGTYSPDLHAYKLEDFTIPSKLTFDASDVRVKNEGFELKDVQWDLGTDQKKGLKITQDFVEEKRYEINVTYTFGKTGSSETLSASEKIIIEGKNKEISPNLKISLPDGQSDADGLYAPAKITFDASASTVRSGKISKFVYDFGEGKPASEGDAVKTYEYDIPGEYVVTLTIVKDDGSRDSIKRNIIVKELPKKLSIHSSVSSGKVGYGIDFDTFGSVGQIEKYEWNFGDGSSTASEPNPTHTYTTAGKYSVKLSVTYSDGTVRTADLDMNVEE